jgi:hypothetical protein
MKPGPSFFSIFLPELAQMHIHNVGFDRKSVFPHVLKKHLLRDQLPRVSHEILKQLKFSRGQLNLFFAKDGHAIQQI